MQISNGYSVQACESYKQGSVETGNYYLNFANDYIEEYNNMQDDYNDLLDEISEIIQNL